MALSKRLTLENGIVLPDAYIRIANIKFERSKSGRVILEIAIYKNLETYEDNKPEIMSIRHTCSSKKYKTYFSSDVLNESDTNYLSQAYLWLKEKVYLGADNV